MDWELLVLLSCVLSAIVGVLCGILAGYYYARFDRKNSDGVLVPILALPVQSALVLVLPKARDEALLPLVFLFLIIAASVIMVWIGLKVHSRAGSRIALSGLFSAYAYLLALSMDYYGFVNRGFWQFVTTSLFR
jgi:uncharacterized membrane protein HdeD (DUF308 family)